jgi:hypothetical protein
MELAVVGFASGCYLYLRMCIDSICGKVKWVEPHFGHAEALAYDPDAGGTV